MSSLRRATAAIAVIVALAPALAAAEPHRWPGPKGEPAQASIDEARARYSAGNRAVEAGRWADALGDFERSYALSGVSAALFNLATTLRALGRHVEARDAFDQLLSAHPDADPGQREKARALRDEEQGRIATLTLEDLPPKADVTVSIDGRKAADDGSRPLVVELDPTRHELRVERAKHKPMQWRGPFSDGEKRTLTVKLEPEPAAEAPAPAPVPAKGGGVLRSPIFWTIVGAAVVGGAATGLYFGLRGGGTQLEPGSPNVVHL
jgi:hypothetical protein